MNITAWRIVKAKHAATAFDGEGARRFGGRWNNKGTRIVYTAGSQALAVLELLVHLEDSDLLKHYRLIPITFDESTVSVLNAKTLPSNWNRRPAPMSVRRMGDDWVASAKSAVLRVPSVVVPNESNYLFNVAHADFSKASIGKPQKYLFDRRLG